MRARTLLVILQSTHTTHKKNVSITHWSEHCTPQRPHQKYHHHRHPIIAPPNTIYLPTSGDGKIKAKIPVVLHLHPHHPPVARRRRRRRRKRCSFSLSFYAHKSTKWATCAGELKRHAQCGGGPPQQLTHCGFKRFRRVRHDGRVRGLGSGSRAYTTTHSSSPRECVKQQPHHSRGTQQAASMTDTLLVISGIH